MATKKKLTKKSIKSKKTAGSKTKAVKKQVKKGKAARKSTNKPTQRKPNKVLARTKRLGKKAVTGRKTEVETKQTQKKGPGRVGSSFSRDPLGPSSAGQSGDLQGLSDVERADSESVDELIEEGNAFEAGVVAGVEEADERGDREVRTREVPEDDVPGEYLDED